MSEENSTVESGILRGNTVTPQPSLPASNRNLDGTALKDASLPPLVISKEMRKHYFNGMGRRLIAAASLLPPPASYVLTPVSTSPSQTQTKIPASQSSTATSSAITHLIWTTFMIHISGQLCERS